MIADERRCPAGVPRVESVLRLAGGRSRVQRGRAGETPVLPALTGDTLLMLC